MTGEIHDTASPFRPCAAAGKMPGMAILLAVLAALAVASGAFFIWSTVRTVNRGFRRTTRDFLRNRKAVISVICALALVAGGAVDRKYPMSAIIIVVVGFSLALTVARLGR